MWLSFAQLGGQGELSQRGGEGVLSRTHRQILPQAAVLLPHRESPALRQLHPRLRREAGAEFPQHRALEVGQDPVHVHQHPQRCGRAAHPDPDPGSRLPAHAAAAPPAPAHAERAHAYASLHEYAWGGGAPPRQPRVGTGLGSSRNRGKAHKSRSPHPSGPRSGRDAAAASSLPRRKKHRGASAAIKEH